MVEFKFEDIAKNAKFASKKIASLSTEIKNKALLNIAEALGNASAEIFEANKVDLEEAKNLLDSGDLSQSTFNRLKLR